MHRTVRGLPASLLLLAGTLVSVAVPGLAQEISEGTPVPDSDSRFYTVPDFEFTDRSGETLTIDSAYVHKHVSEIAKNADLSRFIL